MGLSCCGVVGWVVGFCFRRMLSRIIPRTLKKPPVPSFRGFLSHGSGRLIAGVDPFFRHCLLRLTSQPFSLTREIDIPFVFSRCLRGIRV